MGKITVQEIKAGLRDRNLPLSGNKSALLDRLSRWEGRDNSARAIQRAFLRNLFNKQKTARGPALFDRQICTNSSDPLTSQSLDSIPHQRFFSYEHAPGVVFGYDIRSLLLLLSEWGGRCPYTRALISEDVRQKAALARRSFAVFFKGERVSGSRRRLERRSAELKCRAVFSDLSRLGLTVDYNWFWQLNSAELRRYVREAYNIWYLRLPLSDRTRRRIWPGHSREFTRCMNRVDTPGLSLSFLRDTGLILLKGMTSSARLCSDKVSGAHYALGALTLVSAEAARGLPWLDFGDSLVAVVLEYEGIQRHCYVRSSDGFTETLQGIGDELGVESGTLIRLRSKENNTRILSVHALIASGVAVVQTQEQSR